MIRRILTGCIVLVAAGCASHTHTLGKGSSPEVVTGTFMHGQPNQLVLSLAGQTYVADGFNIRSHSNLAELRRRYAGTDPRHWNRIFAGFDKDHESYSAEPRLRAQNGAELSCRMAWSAGQNPVGTCQDKSGQEYQLRFD